MVVPSQQDPLLPGTALSAVYPGPPSRHVVGGVLLATAVYASGTAPWPFEFDQIVKFAAAAPLISCAVPMRVAVLVAVAVSPLPMSLHGLLSTMLATSPNPLTVPATVKPPAPLHSEPA